MKAIVHYLDNGKRHQKTVYTRTASMSGVVREFIRITGLSSETYIDTIEHWYSPAGLRHICRWKYKAYTAFRGDTNND